MFGDSSKMQQDCESDVSLSDTNSDLQFNNETTKTPPNFTSNRQKRRRESPGTELEIFKAEIREMIKECMLSHENELKKITPTLLQIKESNINIENSIAFLAAQNDELKKKVEKLEKDKKEDREYINILEEKIEDMQRESRKKNIEIKNVPKNGKETRDDLINMVIKLAKEIKCEVATANISDIYRVRGKQGKNLNSPIIVELSTSILKTDFLQKCKQHNLNKPDDKLCAKHMGFTTNESTPVYVSEHLTAKAARLRFLAKDLAKSKNYTFCWTMFGRVFIRKNDTSESILIRTQPSAPQAQALYAAPPGYPGGPMVTPAGGAQWVDASGGQVPAGAVQGGQDCSGEPMYVARAQHEGALLPGKLVPSHGCAYVPWGGQENGKAEYQVLVGGPNNWVPVNGANIPPGAFPGGSSEDGEPLYVGRVRHEGSVTVGKVQQSHGVCYISFAGQELGFPDYEILMP